VLLAVHAFVPVALLHRSLQRLGDPAVSAPPARARLAAIVTGNAEGLALLERYGRPTPLGAALLRGLRELHEECASSG
jgi:HEXXH motif-containing protein